MPYLYAKAQGPFLAHEVTLHPLSTVLGNAYLLGVSRKKTKMPLCMHSISLVCQQSHIAHLQALGDLVLQIPIHAIATFSRVVPPSLLFTLQTCFAT